ncbi:MAG: cytochrome c-type biogenesis protein CcmF [Saliniramus fredricksonii]|uniref:Cytochrome c-type biogenesis protein CcmF n=1 Tax=Saliniramus fredricksonii TaxID=1653334 RepID=A0A0P7XBI4_9HYPH|nr:heme lyase CcmF/NrfE family subunit [Saliniramus fredricksonii]KPQ12629.1 MAG: cytochrome c-type biogenesis protein CcmF [Saliniramus fredricksonii]SCC82695.1 cytochrome c-type biogenesis protein CcmF [Saliniramus fredricksonii]
MLIEVGHFALALALGLSVIQMVVPFWGARTNDPVLMSVGAPASVGVFVLVLFSFGVLTYAYVTSDFSLTNVYANSHSQKPMIYKVTGVWGNHEGSMLLWIVILTLFGALVGIARNAVPLKLRANTIAVQASVTIAFLLFLLLSSNPFERIDQAPFEGRDLNPILQDIGLAIHPPLLYIGYVGFSITFAFAMAALIEGKIDAVWARAVRPWTLGAWLFLTLGISMGSYWAYYELGWGGWWFWDPVENASLLPWILGTALIHSTVVMEKRDALKIWTILLAILTFSLSLMGTFLVRSGVLTSVHAFAVDPDRGMYILAILVFFIGGSLALFAWRAPLLRQGGIFAPVSREGALVINNLFLATACATVLIGTLYPLALEAVTGAKISVGPPFFNATFVPLMVPLLLLLPFGQVMAWKRGDVGGVAQRLAGAILVSVVLTVIVYGFTYGGPVAAPLGVGLGIFLIVGALNEVVTRSFSGGAGFADAMRKARGLPRSTWGTVTAHAGVGVMVIGIAATAWSTERIVTMRPGDVVHVGGAYSARLDAVFPRTGPNFQEDVARMTILRGDRAIGEEETSKRFYPARNMPTTQAGLHTVGFSQVYLSFGEPQSDGALGLRLYYKPLILLIWIGTIFMALGAGIAMTDRRFRVGAPVRAKREAPLSGPAPAPAE